MKIWLFENVVVMRKNARSLTLNFGAGKVEIIPTSVIVQHNDESERELNDEGDVGCVILPQWLVEDRNLRDHGTCVGDE